MGKVFISYRREDAAGYARAIYEELTERFGPERVFMDVDAIEPGLPFDEVIRNAVGQCEVLLVLIGARWLAPQSDGRSRLEDERDFVRLEIAAALARKIRVIPVLLDGTPMPQEAELPEALRGLVWRNALELSNTRFGADISRLVEVLTRVLGGADEAMRSPGEGMNAPPSGRPAVVAPAPAPPVAAEVAGATAGNGGGRQRTAVVAGLVVLAAAIAAIALWPQRTPPPPVADKVVAGNAPPRLALALPAYGVVFGSDRTLAAARDEIRRASRSGVEGAEVYFRNGHFASIAPAESRAEAERILGIVRAFGTDPYATRMEAWCAQPQARDGYVECAGTAATQ